jgi:PAS domain S-box-containing protein
LKPHRIPSIRSWLTRLVAICLIPALVIAAVFLYFSYQRERAELVRGALSEARALMLTVDREFGGVERTLRALSTSPSLEKVDLPAFYRQASDVLPGNYISAIVLVDAAGQQQINTAGPFGQPLPKVGTLAGLENAPETGRATTSDLFEAALPAGPAIDVAIPVRAGGQPYSLVGRVSPQHLQEILVNRRLPPDRIAAIADSAYRIVARTRELERLRGKPVSAALKERLDAQREGVFETVTLDGIPVMTVFVRSERSNWSVAIGIPVASLTADLLRQSWVLAGFAALLLAASLGLAWRMGGRIAGAVRALGPPAATLGYGQPVEVPPLPIREADEVARAMTRASGVLTGTGEALKASEARMRGILESAMDAIIVIDHQDTIVMFNPAACRMFGYPAGEAIGSPVARLIPARFHRTRDAAQPPDRPPDAGSSVPEAAAMATGLRRSGQEFPVEVSYSSGIEAGAVFHTLIVRDITSRMRDYEVLERSNLDLQQFAYVASHDLKTPLRSIGGFVQILERDHAGKLDDKARSLISRISAAVKRLEQLTEDLLSYARVNSEVRPFAEVDCAEMVEEVIQLLDAAIRSSAAQVTVGALPKVVGDRTQLVQLMLNLIGNGIKYCKGHAPVVRLSAKRGEGEWVFSVQDNGIGIDARHHARIFEVFKRLHTQTEYPGTGIGLAVCRRVVERHGGKIWVASGVGEGSTFSFTIPDSSSEGSSS